MAALLTLPRSIVRSKHVDRRTTAYAYIVRGQACLARSRPTEAQKAWQKAQKLDPGSPEAEMARQWLDALKQWDSSGGPEAPPSP